MDNIKVGFYKVILCLMLLLVGGYLHQARAQAPPHIGLSTDKQIYQQGEPIVLSIGLTNVSDTLQQFGPIRVWGARLSLTIHDEMDQEVSLHSLWNGSLISTWIEDEKSATYPGETEYGSLILTHFYNLTQPGTYTLDLSYAETTLESTGKRNIFRQRTVGLENETTTITIQEPASASDTQAAQLFTTALQDQLGLRQSPDVAQAYTQIIQQYPGSYLVEQAYYYLAFYKENTNRGSVAALQETLQAYQNFLQLYPTSIFVEFAVEGLNNTRFLLNSPSPGQVKMIDIFMEAICGDNLFRIANFNQQTVSVRYEVAETMESANLVLLANADTLLRTESAGELTRLFLNNELIQARFANPSSCGLYADSPDSGSCLQIPAEADITFATTSVWGTGYNAEITLINTGTETIRGWQLSFDQAPDVTNLWNGQLTSQGTRRTVTNAGHNGVIAPGASTTFGLQVQNSSVVEPTGYSFNPDQCADGGPSVDIAFATTSVWGTGYNAEITLTNTGSEAIRGWQLSFDQVPDVTNLWNGQLTSDGSRRTVTDAGHNGVIAPGQSVTFGFQVQSGSVVEPSDYEFAFWTLGPPQ